MRPGVVIGDFNERNSRVTRDARISLLDCDSMQISDAATRGHFFCRVGRPEFTPPELINADWSKTVRQPSSDLFALAIHIYQFLLEGEHPFRGVWNGPGDKPSVNILAAQATWAHQGGGMLQPRPSAIPADMLPRSIMSMFKEAFEDGAVNPAARPTARAWHQALHRSGSQPAPVPERCQPLLPGDATGVPVVPAHGRSHRQHADAAAPVDADVSDDAERPGPRTSAHDHLPASRCPRPASGTGGSRDHLHPGAGEPAGHPEQQGAERSDRGGGHRARRDRHPGRHIQRPLRLAGRFRLLREWPGKHGGGGRPRRSAAEQQFASERGTTYGRSAELLGRLGRGRLQQDVSDRQNELNEAQNLSVDALPNGDALKTALVGALQNSLNADNYYLDWANDVGSCSGMTAPSDSNLVAASSASKTAVSYKNQFVALWKHIAQDEGYPTLTEQGM